MYQIMHEVLNEGIIGDFKLEKFNIDTKNDFYARINGIPSGNYVRLRDKNNDVVMSDTPMEKRTNKELVWKANGDVFIAGLGIGLILLPIQEKEEVKSITVLEKYPEVIELVGKQLPLNEKVKIIQGDVFDYEFPKGTRFDTIYFDIWNWVNSDVYNEEMKVLKNKYRKYRRSSTVNPNVYVKCWAEHEAKNGRRLY